MIDSAILEPILPPGDAPRAFTVEMYHRLGESRIRRRRSRRITRRADVVDKHPSTVRACVFRLTNLLARRTAIGVNTEIILDRAGNAAGRARPPAPRLRGRMVTRQDVLW
jgi:hypothetical protein